MNFTAFIPIMIAIVAGLVSVYAAMQARGTESAKIGQIYTEKYLDKLEKRVEKLEAENERLKEQNQLLKDRLREAGIK